MVRFFALIIVITVTRQYAHIWGHILQFPDQPSPAIRKLMKLQHCRLPNLNLKPSRLSCNYQACSEAYRSFDALDCSYQPYDGPRRQCWK